MKKLHAALLVLLVSLFFSSGSFAEPVDINTADAQTLSRAIKGVGRARAEAIVAYRSEHGPFKTVDELTQVKGIGLKIIESNRDNIVVTSE